MSQKGASFFIIKTYLINQNLFEIYSSNKQLEEIQKVIKRMKNKYQFQTELLINLYNKITIIKNLNENNYLKYVNDENDSFIVAQAIKIKANYLLTFNIKDYKIKILQDEFNINILKPGYFLQYLRNMNLI